MAARITEDAPGKAAAAPPRDSLGCTLSRLSRDEAVEAGGLVFRRKSAAGDHRSEVATPAQERGLLVGLSLVDGHLRQDTRRGRRGSRIFDRGMAYLRDFDSDYAAAMDGAFDFFLIELPAGIEAEAGVLAGLDPGAGLDRVEAEPDPALLAIARGVLPALADPCRADRLRLEELAVLASAHLLSRYRRAGAAERLHRLCGPALRQAQDRLMSREEGATIAAIAADLGMSRSGFFAAFRAATGQTPHQWLQAERVRRARQMLVAGNRSMAEIALACGFSDQSHFTRQFVQATGLPPGRWRGRLALAAPAQSGLRNIS
ncbi:AraC family transcriptional regulator [Mangrovicoccus sp. HB161399]|uniref:helix-turn-helix domain-containing protein n=1 Tax=Mangrovicoccus sp. HB161399 TaxID=2720392 RepID=UPI0015582BDB|nr:AraC family transcriptional regulator [Mangrovicoccus sp. HB161399]